MTGRWSTCRLTLYLLIICAKEIRESVATEEEPDSVNEILPSHSDQSTPDGSLWNKLLRDCKDLSVSCVKQSVFRYFDQVLETTSDNVNITNYITLNKRNVSGATANMSSSRFNSTKDAAGALKETAIKFMVTHDLEVALPAFLFGGSVLKISPRSLDTNEALLKLALLPRESNEFGTPRIFFKKIKKFLGNKLLVALLAILLVIKLLAVKFLFFIPTVIGVAAAKKLLLKVILFVFPFIGHLFKLCPYYSPTKFHHHHHQISHLHKIPGLHSLPSLHGVELDHPPLGYETHYDTDIGYYSDGPSFNDHRKVYSNAKVPPSRVSTGGVGVVPSTEDDTNDYAYIGTSGQGQQHILAPPPQIKKTYHYPLSPTEIENMVLKAEKEAMLKGRLQEEQKRVDSENKRLQEQIKSSLKFQEKLKLQSIIAKQNSKLTAATISSPTIIHAGGGVLPPQILHPPPPQYVTAIHPASAYIAVQPQSAQRHNQLHQTHQLHTTLTPVNEVPSVMYPTAQQTLTQGPVYVQQTLPKIETAATLVNNYDAFYSPILDKIDKILSGLDFNDEPCRERLICSMYKNPNKFSPHSNLISAELSRDADELQKPTSSNSAVIRFYKYVQAARDGQDKRDCVRLYAACAINTD